MSTSRDMFALYLELRRQREELKRIPAKSLTSEEVRQQAAAFVEQLRSRHSDSVAEPAACQHCGGSGWRGEVTDGIRRVSKCSCATVARVKPQTVAELPAEFAGARLDTYRRRLENAHGVQAAEELLRGLRRHVYVFGPVGVGKSRLVASILNELAVLGSTAAFIRVPWLFLLQARAIEDASHKADATALLNHALRASVIALDDIAGGEKPSDHTRGLMLTIVERRLDRDLTTLFTSNLSPDRLSAFYGDDRVCSRIAGACGEAIELAGPDGRLQSIEPRRRNMRIVDR
jgi:DNA replication protein DnaC